MHYDQWLMQVKDDHRQRTVHRLLMWWIDYQRMYNDGILEEKYWAEIRGAIIREAKRHDSYDLFEEERLGISKGAIEFEKWMAMEE